MKNFIIFLMIFPFFGTSQDVVEEEFKLFNGQIELPGTLSYLEGTKKMPLVIFIHGSGNVDRNGNQGVFVQANYIKILADSLNARNIAFYRYDKRTATPSNLTISKAIGLESFKEDARVAIAHFEGDKRFTSIHLIGHSQGALIAMLALDASIKTYTSLAGAPQPIDMIIVKQITKQSTDLGELAREHFAELATTDTIETVNPMLLSIFAPNNHHFLKSWMAYDPSIEIKKIKIPTLIINGDQDIQVSVEDAQILKEALPAAQFEIIPKMNHVLKTIDDANDNIKSYASADFPLSKEMVKVLSKFILTHE